MKKIINWKMFFILLTSCVIAALLVIPYSLTLTQAPAEISLKNLLLIAVQNLILFMTAIFLGLLLSKRVGLGLPLLEGALEGENQSAGLKSILPPSLGLGAVAGILIVLLSIPFNRLIPELGSSGISIAPWKAFLASFYGGIAEEVLLRLFAVSLFVWISFKIRKTSDGSPAALGIWISIVLAAVFFGLGHLPATAQITPLTGLVITRAILLNGIGGVIFGWLYWKKGLESAMIAHFTSDIVLHVITPAVSNHLIS
jgi:membrane protease YdiL (CAAX protease family)